MVEGLELQTKIPIKFQHNGKDFEFEMKELSAGDVWAIRQQCTSFEDDRVVIDSEKQNRMFIAKCITKPGFTIESAGELPARVTAIILDVFNKVHSADPEDLKKTTQQENTKEL